MSILRSKLFHLFVNHIGKTNYKKNLINHNLILKLIGENGVISLKNNQRRLIPQNIQRLIFLVKKNTQICNITRHLSDTINVMKEVLENKGQLINKMKVNKKLAVCLRNVHQILKLMNLKPKIVNQFMQAQRYYQKLRLKYFR